MDPATPNGEKISIQEEPEYNAPSSRDQSFDLKDTDRTSMVKTEPSPIRIPLDTTNVLKLPPINQRGSPQVLQAI